MQRIFNIGEGFLVPDGTVVHSIIDPNAMKQCGGKIAKDLSLALGEIPPNTTSKIHVHPVVTQITWIISGRLTVKMKDPAANKQYALELSADQAVLTEAGTFFQLINNGPEMCKVLYIVGPTFVFECNKNGEVLYNDAIVFEQGWDELSKMGWLVPQMKDLEAIKEKRRKVLEDF